MGYILQLFALFSHAFALSLSPLLGPGLVGTVALELVDYSRNDPLAPSPRHRDLMISVFYPVEHVRRYTLAPAYPPAYAAYLDALVGIAPGTAESLLSQAYEGAHLHPSRDEHHLVLLFSPGYGDSRIDYTAALSNLASNGYLVIGVDHPYDTNFIAYPDGSTTVKTVDTLNNLTQITETVDIRVQDVQFVLNALSTNATLAKQIPGLHGKLDISHVGIYGHSLGGATAASAMFADPRFKCGVNMDGTMVGPVVDNGITTPFFLMSSTLHNISSDASWSTFWAHQHGYKLEVTVEGSTHADFSDQSVLYDDLRALNLIPDEGDLFGTIGGERMLEIENAYLGAFFDMCLRGKKEKLLEGPSKAFAEVVFYT